MKRIDQINRLFFAYDLGFNQIPYRLNMAVINNFCELDINIIDDMKMEEVIFIIEIEYEIYYSQ